MFFKLLESSLTFKIHLKYHHGETIESIGFEACVGSINRNKVEESLEHVEACGDK